MDSAVPPDSNASVDRQLVAWIETVSVRGVAGWMAKHAQALGVLAVAAGYGLAIVYLTLGLGAVGLSPLDSGYSLADVTPYALVIALYFVAAAASLVSCVAALWMLGHQIGLVARRATPRWCEFTVAAVTACASAWLIISSSWIEAGSGQQQVFSIAILILAAAASVELLTTATPLRSLPLIATGTLASIAILMATFDQIAYALESPLDGLTSINAADPVDIAEGTYEVPAWHQAIGYDLLRVSSADGKTSLYDGRCFVFVNTVDGTALLWQGDDLGILRVSLDGLALAECTD